MTNIRFQNCMIPSLFRQIGNFIAPREVGEGRLCILNYHRVLAAPDPLLDGDPDIAAFRSQMEMLAECFNVLPLREAVQMLHTERMPARAVCITFDDGYRSIYELALPILQEFNFPATVFVTSGHIGNGNMWNDRIVESIRRMPTGRLDLQEFGMGVRHLEFTHDRVRTVKEVTQSAKYRSLSERQSLTLLLEELAGGTGPDLMLTEEMVLSLSHHGIEIGAHTVTHPILINLDDTTARKEITESKEMLEALLGTSVELFAYPNGKAGTDFDERHVQMVRDVGFTAAFTSEVAAATRMHDRYRIPRALPWDAQPVMFGARMLHWLRGKGT